MNELEKRLREHKKAGETISIAYVMSGDPDPETTVEIIKGIGESGAHAVELGIPFSDPIGDGPVIQEAGRRALMSGTTIKTVFQIAKRVSDLININLIIMTYFNPILQYGITNFFKQAGQNGIMGVIIPDLPFDEGERVGEESEKNGIDIIQLISEMTSLKRIGDILSVAKGFIYLISKPGTTGGTLKLSERIKEVCAAIKKQSDIPVCIGFGVRKNSDISEIKKYSDGFIVGTALIRKIEKGGTPEEKMRIAHEFMKSLIG
jgi:tryptophan synthase alpha chain